MAQSPAELEARQEAERLAALEASYAHVASKADVAEVRTDIADLRTEVANL